MLSNLVWTLVGSKETVLTRLNSNFPRLTESRDPGSSLARFLKTIFGNRSSEKDHVMISKRKNSSPPSRYLLRCRIKIRNFSSSISKDTPRYSQIEIAWRISNLMQFDIWLIRRGLYIGRKQKSNSNLYKTNNPLDRGHRRTHRVLVSI